MTWVRSTLCSAAHVFLSWSILKQCCRFCWLKPPFSAFLLCRCCITAWKWFWRWFYRFSCDIRHSSNSWLIAPFPLDSTRKFTQMIWRSTTRIGCAFSTRPSHYYFVVCMYTPEGNKGDKSTFHSNVRKKISKLNLYRSAIIRGLTSNTASCVLIFLSYYMEHALTHIDRKLEPMLPLL